MAPKKAASKKPAAADAQAEPAGLARLVPTQQRSRERYEKILECAAEMIAEKGSEAFRMSDIVERSGVPFGSLYQYFPDKTAIIGTLAERYNAGGRACVRQELAIVHKAADLRPALCRIVDGYYRMFMREPVMRDIWQATQADRTLQKLDDDDVEFLAGLLLDAFKRVEPRRDAATLVAVARLIMTLIAAAVRHAITLKPKEADRMIVLFKRMLPENPAALTDAR
jgi:AcrR family transcriptional regulator